MIPDEFARTFEFADLYRRGIPPIAGGALDQSAKFRKFCRRLWAEEAQFRTDLFSSE